MSDIALLSPLTSILSLTHLKRRAPQQNDKLTRRRKPERRELATKAEAVGGRVQRLVRPVLVAFNLWPCSKQTVLDAFSPVHWFLPALGPSSQDKQNRLLNIYPTTANKLAFVRRSFHSN